MERVWVEEGMKAIRDPFLKTGLPEELLPVIRERMRDSREQFFHVPHETVVDGKYVYTELGFNWDPSRARHNLAMMGVTLQKDAANVLDTNKFLFLEHNEVSLREAVNLMQGRSVHRMPGHSGQGSYWLTLKTDKQYEGVAPLELKRTGLEIGKAIHDVSLPVALTSTQRMKIERSLQEGNRQALEFQHQGKDYRVWLQANPAEGKVDTLDKKGQRVEWKDFEKLIIKDQAPTLPGHRMHH